MSVMQSVLSTCFYDRHKI